MPNDLARLKLQLLTRPLGIGSVVHIGRHYTVVRVEPAGPMWLHHLKQN